MAPLPQSVDTAVDGDLSLFTHLARTALFLEALQAECLEPFGISFSDYAVLRVLRLAEPAHQLSPSRLAEAVLRTTGGMTKIIDRLERVGLVQRAPDPNDRRGVLVGLTEAGVDVSTRASRAYTRGRQRVLARLAPAEADSIDSGLSRLLEVFEVDREERA
ncbi:MAG TPA: MarR family transcriptional regulator [Acidimicrobiales bacterium]|jgi:DNA-binding MarR family transcriptional regulator|nr:MarR family transcriptional regulator [Acidimicrobiales bacterium]